MSVPASSDPILVVDDNPEMREMVADVLAEEGYDVVDAPDGRQALEVLDVARPRLVLLDLNMPVMNGWEFHARMRSRPDLADIPVVVMSAYDSMPLDTHAAGSLRKPFEWTALLKVVQRACGAP